MYMLSRHAILRSHISIIIFRFRIKTSAKDKTLWREWKRHTAMSNSLMTTRNKKPLTCNIFIIYFNFNLIKYFNFILYFYFIVYLIVLYILIYLIYRR